MMCAPLFLLFPVCAPPIKRKKTDTCSSATAHAITAMAISIISSLLAVTAAFFVTEGNIDWMLTAAGTGIFFGIITYIFMRCLVGQREDCSFECQPTSPPKPSLSNKQIEETPFILGPTCLCDTIKEFPGELTKAEQTLFNLSYCNGTTTKITFGKKSSPEVFIQQQDVLRSGASVVVNQLSDALSDIGDGTRNQLYKYAAENYRTALTQLKEKYSKGYPGGYAMIVENALNETQHVIVVASPWGDASEKKHQLYSCYLNCLQLAHMHKLESIAFPLIGVGIISTPSVAVAQWHNFAKSQAAEIALRAIFDFQTQFSQTTLKKILILYRDPNGQYDKVCVEAAGYNKVWKEDRWTYEREAKKTESSETESSTPTEISFL